MIAVENQYWYNLPLEAETKAAQMKKAVELDESYDTLLGAKGYTRVGRNGLDLLYVANECLEPGIC